MNKAGHTSAVGGSTNTGADPEFLDRGFRLAEVGFDFGSLTNLS